MSWNVTFKCKRGGEEEKHKFDCIEQAKDFTRGTSLQIVNWQCVDEV